MFSSVPKPFVILGALFGFLSVAFGAFGAHALKAKLPADMLVIFETGVRYQMYHALALFAVAWAASVYSHHLVPAAGWAFTAGIVIFSGSLYILALSGVRTWGAVTPIGGLCLLAGWCFLLIGVLKSGS